MDTKCFKHPEKNASNKCYYCHRFLCSDCLNYNKKYKRYSCKNQSDCLAYQEKNNYNQVRDAQLGQAGNGKINHADKVADKVKEQKPTYTPVKEPTYASEKGNELFEIICWIGATIFGIALAFILIIIMPEVKLIFITFLAISPFILIYFFIVLITTLFKGQQEIVCPFCKAILKIYKEQRNNKINCLLCKNELLLKNIEEPFVLFICPFCKTEIGASDNCDDIKCLVCGLEIILSKGEPIVKNQNYQCPSCGKKIFKILYCLNCGNLICDSFDRSHRESPFVNYASAKYLLVSGNQNFSQNFNFLKKLDYLDEIIYICGYLKKSLSFEENFPLVIDQVREIDILYAKILNGLAINLPPVIKEKPGDGYYIRNQIDLILSNKCIIYRDKLIKILKDRDPSLNFVEFKKMDMEISKKQIGNARYGIGQIELYSFTIKNIKIFSQQMINESKRILKNYR